PGGGALGRSGPGIWSGCPAPLALAAFSGRCARCLVVRPLRWAYGQAMANSAEVESVRVSATSGRVKVVAEDRSDVVVRGGTAPRHDGRTVTVDAGPGRVEVRVPSGVDLVVGSQSGRVEV